MRQRLREIRRKLTLRCAHCGHRFQWKRDYRHSFGSREVYHGVCMSYLLWHRHATERLVVLDTVCDITGITEHTVRGVLEMQANDEAQRIETTNRAFRVFYDLDRFRDQRVSGDVA